MFGKILNQLNYVKKIPDRWSDKLENIDCSQLLKEKIATEKVPLYLPLERECWLIDVELIGESMNYLYTWEPDTGREAISVLLKNCIENAPYLNRATDEFSIPKQIRNDPSLLKAISVDVPIDKSVGIRTFDSSEIVNGLVEETPRIIKINPKYPLLIRPFLINQPSGLSFIAPQQIDDLSEVNFLLSNDEIENSLSYSSVVKWEGNFYYVVSETVISYRGEKFEGYSISNDVFLSFKEGKGLAILKEDLKKLERTIFDEVTQPESNCRRHQSDVFSEKQDGYQKFITLSPENMRIVEAFGKSDLFVRYGIEVQQGQVKDWLIENCDHEGNRRILKEAINLWYDITTGRKKTSPLTIR